LHDTFVLLIGSKRIVLPGTARVTVGLAANLDSQDTPGGGNTQAQINEPTGEVSVQLTMTEHAEWLKYRDVLAIFRRGTEKTPPPTAAEIKAGTTPPINRMSIFACAHPEVTSRRIKRLYFVSEQSQPYSPRTGYIVSLVFREQLKAKTGVLPSDDGTGLKIPGSGSGTGPSLTGGRAAVSTSAEGQKVLAAAQRNLVATPRYSRDGYHTTASGGYCSTFARYVWQDSGGDPKYFGDTALQTEGRFKSAELSIPWSAAAQASLQPGDLIFFAHDKSGAGHVGVWDGKNVISNSMVTYLAKHGKVDAAGRATGFDAAGRPVDARGVTSISALGTPTSIGKPALRLVPKKLIQGPPAPISSAPQGQPALSSAPSNNPPAPPGAFRLARPVNATASQFPGVR